FTAICVAVPAVPVAVNVTGDPGSPVDVAAIVFVPGAVPRVQLPTAAMPVAVVVGAGRVTAPPPEAPANVTLTPATALPFASFTITLGAVATAEPAAALWLFPAFRAICIAVPAAPVAVNVTGDPVSPVDVAVIVFVPAVVPSVQLPTVAIPLVFVVCVPLVMLPPPEATTKVTLTPLTALPFASFTITLGSVATADPAVALWLFPAFTAIRAAAPTVPVAVNVTGDPVSPVDVAVKVFVAAVVPRVQPPTVAMPLAF